MKSLFIAFSLMIGLMCNAQKNIVVSEVMDTEDRVILKNGETIPIERVASVWKEDLKVWKKGEKKISKIKVETVDKIIYNAQLSFKSAKSGTFDVNTWKVINTKRGNVLVVEVIDGSCSIYLDPGDIHNPPYTFYALRNDEKRATKIHQLMYPGKKFRKAGAKYFQDCPEVHSMIKKSEAEYKLRFLIPEMETIVGYYNENCGKIEAR